MIVVYFELNHENEFLKQINTYFPEKDYCSFRFVNKYTNIVSSQEMFLSLEISEDEDTVTIIHDEVADMVQVVISLMRNF